MKIHEYQAKQILARYDVPIPRGRVAETPDLAVAAAEEIGSWPVVIKAQVHVGGRGKAGGVKLARSMDEVRKHATSILGMTIKGITVRTVLVEPGIDIKQELYVAIMMDRGTKGPLVIASAAGGMEIEEIAKTAPEKILKLPIPPTYGVRPYHATVVEEFLGVPAESRAQFNKTINGLLKAFTELDCSLAEINPLVLTGAGHVIALDGKIVFDDNALPWHPQLEQLRDDTAEEPLEVRARIKSLNYVKLDGRIGCIVNGAGLAMGTMDVVKHFGGTPANFLDIGGGAKAEQVADALQLITSDPHVDVIFFNIFGGIVRCDLVAQGVLDALAKIGKFDYPIVMRLSGTNEEVAKKMLEGKAGIHLAPSMAEGAQLAVKLSNERRAAKV